MLYIAGIRHEQVRCLAQQQQSDRDSQELFGLIYSQSGSHWYATQRLITANAQYITAVKKKVFIELLLSGKTILNVTKIYS